jgi:hypothetical protein
MGACGEATPDAGRERFMGSASSGMLACAFPFDQPPYGSPRVHAEPRLEHDFHVGRKRVERRMQAAGLSGQLWRRRAKSTIRVQGVRTAPDLVQRDFDPLAVNRLWTADSRTSARARAGRTWQRNGLLHPPDRRLGARRSPVRRARRRRSRWPSAGAGPMPDWCITSDQGSQYTSLVFTQQRRAVGIGRLDGITRRLLR